MAYLLNNSNNNLIDDVLGTKVHTSHFGALKVSPTYPVLRANFPGSSLNTSLWSETTANGGNTVVEDGVGKMFTSTHSAGSIKLKSVNTGLFEAGQVTVYQSGVLPGIGVANNTRIWGLMTTNEQDGLYFKWSGTTFQVASRKAGTETTISSTSFNGEVNYEPNANNNTFRIFYSAGRALFCRSVNGNLRLIHTMINNQLPLVNDLDMGLYYENTNSGNTTDVELRIRGASSSIFGELPTIRANDAIDDSFVMQPVKAVLTGENPNNTYSNVKINSANALNVSNFIFEVALGNISNFNSVNKFGRNSDIDIGTPEDVWEGGGLYSGHPTTSPETVNVFSSDANDTSAGTGMRTVTIYGLRTSTSTAEESETITLNGTSQVTSSLTWYRIYTAEGITYGSGGINAGNITIRHTTTTANVFAVIAAGNGRTTVAAFTIPSGKTGYITALSIYMGRANGSAGSANVSIRVKPNTREGAGNVLRTYIITNQSPIKPDLSLPLVISENTDIKIRVDSVSDSNTQITAEFDIIMES